MRFHPKAFEDFQCNVAPIFESARMFPKAIHIVIQIQNPQFPHILIHGFVMGNHHIDDSIPMFLLYQGDKKQRCYFVTENSTRPLTVRGGYRLLKQWTCLTYVVQ